MGEVLQLPLASSFLIRDPNTLYKLGMARQELENGGGQVWVFGREWSKRERELFGECDG